MSEEQERDSYPNGFCEIEGIGNLGRDPEMRYTPSGKSVCNMNVAMNLRTSTAEGIRTATLWARVTVWDQLAETCNRWLSKGSKIFFKGRVEFDPVTGAPTIFNRSDGTPGTRLEITATTVRFLGGGQRNGDGQSETEEAIEFA